MIMRLGYLARLGGVTAPLGYGYAYHDDFRMEFVYAVVPLHLLLRAWHRWQGPRWALERWMLKRGLVTLPVGMMPPAWPWGWRRP